MLTKGFSLIEVLIAIAVAVVILPAVVVLISFGIFTSQQGETYTKAYAIAQKEMENIYGQKSTWTWAVSSPADSVATTIDDGFTKTIDIKRCISSGIICTPEFNNGETRKVVITIAWKERGENQNISIESYVAKI